MNVTVVGNLCADPELRHTPTGVPVADLRIAENRSYQDSGGAWQQETSYYSAVVWRRLAEHAADSIEKGTEVIVLGQLADDSYEKDGERRRQVVLEAQAIGVSLRFGTAKFTKGARFTAGQREVREVYDGE